MSRAHSADHIFQCDQVNIHWQRKRHAVRAQLGRRCLSRLQTMNDILAIFGNHGYKFINQRLALGQLIINLMMSARSLHLLRHAFSTTS